MKKSFTLVLTFFFIFSAYSTTKLQIDSALNKLYEGIARLQPNYINQESYTELAYLKRGYNIKQLKLNDSIYKSKIINNYYYDQFYLYSKLLNEDAIVSEDCLQIEESTKTLFPMWKKLLIYSLYPNSIKMPTNMVELIDEYSTFDEFFGPYQMLNVIYFLKKYNYKNLSISQKDNLKKIEDRLSTNLFSKYILEKPWSFRKILSVKVLKMNNNTNVKDVDISFLVDRVINNKPEDIINEDIKNPVMISLLGEKKFFEYAETSLLWIFLLNLDNN